jgi:hypothetical protein
MTIESGIISRIGLRLILKIRQAGSEAFRCAADLFRDSLERPYQIDRPVECNRV